MSKKFYFIKFCVFVCFTIASFFIGLPVTTCLSMFMASLYLVKIINA